MKNKKTKKLGLVKIKISRIDNLYAIKGGRPLDDDSAKSNETRCNIRTKRRDDCYTLPRICNIVISR